MKILLTTHLFLPDHFAGTEILVYSSAKELQRRGYDVQVLTGHAGAEKLQDAERFDQYVYDGISVSRFHYAMVPMGNEQDLLRMEYENLFVAEWFRNYLKNIRPDIVHFFHLARLSASLIDVCMEAGIPMVVTPTDFWFVCPTFQLLLPDNSCCKGPDKFSINCIRHLDYLDKPGDRTIVKKSPDWFIVAAVLAARMKILPRRRFAFVYAVSARAAFLMKRLNSVQRIIIPSSFLGQILVKNGLNEGIINFSRFGLNLNQIPENIQRASSDNLRLGFIGSLYEHKGIHVLLKAMKMLRNEKFITLKVYGENRSQPDFLKYLHELAEGDDRVSFCGTFPNSKIGEILAEIDLLIVPSTWYENTPLVIYSALAAGCPIIASNLGGMAEVVHDMKNGILVEPGNPAALADAIRRISDERSLVARLAAGCQRPKSISVYVDELLEIYREVLKS